MSREYSELGTPALPNRVGLSIIYENGKRADRQRSRQVVQCSACFQMTEYTEENAICELCGAQINASSSTYSGHELDALVVTGHESFLVKPAKERRHPRVPCRKVKACIKTEKAASVVVDVVNISRNGLCFLTFEQFCPGTAVSIATHYIEGGQNIFQNGQVIRVQQRPVSNRPGEYEVELSFNQRPDNQTGPSRE
jgi:hypothetical protein